MRGHAGAGGKKWQDSPRTSPHRVGFKMGNRTKGECRKRINGIYRYTLGDLEIVRTDPHHGDSPGPFKEAVCIIQVLLTWHSAQIPFSGFFS